MNCELQAMSEKMKAWPLFSADLQGIHAQMSALPVLETEVHGDVILPVYHGQM
jgi:hypothetical protein